ncbi:MAG: hypothetical protein GY774_18630 [Planctomycetes bacterium]|nr:hypothetical protein [Planctomycetota bacterium]
MEDFLNSLHSLLETFLNVPSMFYLIFFSPWRFFNNLPPNSYTGYLAASVTIVAGVLTPQMPIRTLPKRKWPLIPKVILYKIANFISKFLFRWMILYVALLFGVILYIIYLPFAYPINWRIHYQGLVYAFSTLCIFYCIILLLDRVFFRFYGNRPILNNLKIMLENREKERLRSLQKKQDAADDRPVELSSQLNSVQVKSIRGRLISYFRMVKDRAEMGRIDAKQILENSSRFQKIILWVLFLYGLVFTFAAMSWLHL